MPHESVSDLLLKELSGLRGFCALIQEERKLLVAAQPDGLPDIAARKFALAKELRQLENRRDELLAGAGFRAGRPGVEAWLASRPGSGVERRQWEDLIKLATQARDGNETNGRLISALLKQNQEALSVLLSGGGGDSIYGADGQPSTTMAAKRSLGTG